MVEFRYLAFSAVRDDFFDCDVGGAQPVLPGGHPGGSQIGICANGVLDRIMKVCGEKFVVRRKKVH